MRLFNRPKTCYFVHRQEQVSNVLSISQCRWPSTLTIPPVFLGKTNVACLTMLNILGQYRKVITTESMDERHHEAEEKASFDLNSFKIVYIAPMKALVQEQVKNFSHRLADYGVVVRELSGDSSLTRQQIAETQVLVVSIDGDIEPSTLAIWSDCILMLSLFFLNSDNAREMGYCDKTGRREGLHTAHQACYH